MVVVGQRPTQAASVIDTYVGGGNGDGDVAINATIDPRGLITVGPAASPSLYIADGRNNRVRRVDGQTGLIETVAGNGSVGFSGDGGSAVNASLNLPLDVARDTAGNLYIADLKNNRIRKVTPAGQISTFAGNGSSAFSGDNGLATQAALYAPYGVAVGPDGYVYIADLGNNRIRRVGPAGCVPSTCIITTVVGSGVAGYSGDGGPAAAAALRNPADVAFDGAGNMLIADWSNHRIRKVSNGIISTIAGGGIIINGSFGDGGPAIRGVLRYPTQIATDTAGNVYIADSQHRLIRFVQASNQFIYTVAGTGTQGSTGDGGPAVQADMYDTYGVAVGSNGAFWATQTADTPKSQHNRVRYVQGGIIESIVGGGLGDGGPAYDALIDPRGATSVQRTAGTADLYFADGPNHVVRWVDGATATMHTIAGVGVAGYSGDGGPATQAKLNMPVDVALDPAGNVYVADANNVVRRIDSRGIITTVAGNGTRGYSGDGGPAVAAQLSGPTGITVDNNGRLYIADNNNYRVRMVRDGTISTIAGTGASGYGGDGGPATAAKLQNPFDVAVTDTGIVYIADTFNHRIRRIDGNGTITTYAGVGFPGFTGDGGPAFAARIYAPTALALDAGGRLFVSDSHNLRVRMIDSSATHIITTVAGNGLHGVSGDGGPATAASIDVPTGIAVAPSGQMLFITSDENGLVRIVSFTGTLPTPMPPLSTATPTRTRTPVPQNGTISGGITYYSNQQVVPSVAVRFTGSFSSTIQTSAQGQYSVSLPQGRWVVEPARSGAIGTAVSSLDAALVLQTVAGGQPLTDQQRLACDTSGDGTISTLDAVYILQFVAGLIDQLPAARICGSDWLFDPKPAAAQNQTIVRPVLTGGTCRPGSILFNPLAGAAAGQNFSGIVFGDCTGNWSAASGALRQVASGAPVVHAGPQRARPGNRFTIPIYVASATPFRAADLRLRYDAAATFAGAIARGDAVGALTSSRAGDGHLAVSLASAAPIGGRHGSILLLQFRGARPAIAIDGALVDEQPARVVTHRPSR